jgi:glycosyltransferase involved in cell wall biosynthesis
MRIGIVSGEFPPLEGGVGDFAAQLALSLGRLGHEFHVITSRAPGKSYSEPEVDVHRLSTSWRWGCWRKIVRLARKLGLDVLNLHYQAAAYGLRGAINFVPRAGHRPPVVVTFHDLRVPYLFPKAGRLRWQAVRLLARRADGVIATNEEDHQRLQTEVEAARLAHVPIGSAIPVVAGVDRAAERRKWGVEPTDFLLGHFGFLNQSKGVEELLQATRLVIDQGLRVRLLMIGGSVGSSDPTNARQAAAAQRLITRLGLEGHIGWTGRLPPEETSAALTATDACVLPYRDGASFRRTTLHACLAHGRAVVTTRPAIDLLEIRDGDNVLLVEPRQAEPLAEAVRRVASDEALRARLESGAAQLAGRFSWDRIGRETAAFLRGFTHGRE